ncbi:MAG: MmcQ/YjbR family DNA-binding protein [Telluria sp.]
MNVEKAMDLCRGFPGAEEDIKWGAARVFSVGGKMFAAVPLESSKTISFKVDDERFLELTDRPGIVPAPYFAQMKWVQVEQGKAMSDKEAGELLRRAYDIIFAKLTRKLQREIGGAA